MVFNTDEAKCICLSRWQLASNAYLQLCLRTKVKLVRKSGIQQLLSQVPFG
jgi:hypothetical protein